MDDVAGDVTDVGACHVQRGDHGPATNVGTEPGGVDPDLLASTPAAVVTLSQVRYHPEAIMLGVTPAEADGDL